MKIILPDKKIQKQKDIISIKNKTGEKYHKYPLSFLLPENKRIIRLLKIFLSSFIIIISFPAFSQDSNVSFKGYIKYLSMYYNPEMEIPGYDEDYLISNLFHNRLNFRWYATNHFTVAMELRNRFIFGKMVEEFPDYKETIDMDPGYVNLSKTIISGDSWFLHSIIDRAWLDYTKGNLQIRIGRQRINWGINLVWNPNDVFNSFSYFDFDYEERPGTDAIKIQYYTGVTSSAELVYKISNENDKTALAGMYRFSKWNYDFQFIGGKVGRDIIAGTGWAGDIKGAGFRGEITFFTPTDKNNGSIEALVASISADYTFNNSIYIHAGFLYNSHGKEGKAGGRTFFDQNLSAKMLSLAKYSLFGQTSYPLTPLVSVSFSGMLNPMDKSFFAGPSLSYSLGNNLELLVNGQLFFGDEGTEFGDYGKAVYGRIKWAF